MRKYLLLLLFVFALASCAPDPRKQAQANAIQEKADQDALNQTWIRQQQADKHAQQMEIARLDLVRRQAINNDIINSFKVGISWIGPVLIACIIYLAFISTKSAMYYAVEKSHAMAEAAHLQARFIPLDKVTGQFPAIFEYLGDGTHSIADPNTGAVIMLNASHPGDRPMIQGAYAVRHAMVLADRAKQHEDDPTGVSIIGQAPLMIDYTEVPDEQISNDG